MAAFGSGYRFHVTGLAHDETGFPTGNEIIAGRFFSRLINKIEDNKDDIVTYEEYKLDDAEIAIVSFGSIARSARSAVDSLREMGYKIGLFRPITIWPSAEAQLIELGKKMDKIYVVELNAGQYFLEVDRLSGKYAQVEKYGKINGEIITPEEIINLIKEENHAK